MIRQSLIMALEKFALEQTDCDPVIINFALENLKQNAFHKKLRNELIMLPIPKVNGGKNKSNNTDLHFLERAVERVSFYLLKYSCSMGYTKQTFSLHHNIQACLQIIDGSGRSFNAQFCQ